MILDLWSAISQSLDGLKSTGSFDNSKPSSLFSIREKLKHWLHVSLCCISPRQTSRDSCEIWRSRDVTPDVSDNTQLRRRSGQNVVSFSSRAHSSSAGLFSIQQSNSYNPQEMNNTSLFCVAGRMAAKPYSKKQYHSMIRTSLLGLCTNTAINSQNRTEQNRTEV